MASPIPYSPVVRDQRRWWSLQIEFQNRVCRQSELPDCRLHLKSQTAAFSLRPLAFQNCEWGNQLWKAAAMFASSLSTNESILSRILEVTTSISTRRSRATWPSVSLSHHIALWMVFPSTSLANISTGSHW